MTNDRRVWGERRRLEAAGVSPEVAAVVAAPALAARKQSRRTIRETVPPPP